MRPHYFRLDRPLLQRHEHVSLKIALQMAAAAFDRKNAAAEAQRERELR